MSHFSLVSLPAAPEDTHEESVRHTVVSTFFFLKREKKKEFVWIQTKQPRAKLVARVGLGSGREISVQLRLGAPFEYTLSVPSQCVDAKVG